MQIKTLIYSLAAAALLMATMPASADEARPYHGLSDQERQEARERWDEMSAEERAEARRQGARAHGERGRMTAEEREAHREAMQERWEGMTPEEREAHREAMQQRRGAMTPEEREAHRQMMRDRHADDPQEGAYGKRKGYGREKSKDKKD